MKLYLHHSGPGEGPKAAVPFQHRVQYNGPPSPPLLPGLPLISVVKSDANSVVMD